MILLNKDAKKKYGLTQTVTDYGFSTSYYKRGVGWAYVFDVDGYKVTKNVFNDGYTTYDVSGKNISKPPFKMSVLNMDEVKKENEKLRLEILTEIMSSDLTDVKKAMIKNKKGFTFFMNNLIEKGVPKGIAFGNVVRDYYNDYNSFCSHKGRLAVIKIMVMYGYTFTNMKEAMQQVVDNRKY